MCSPRQYVIALCRCKGIKCIVCKPLYLHGQRSQRETILYAVSSYSHNILHSYDNFSQTYASALYQINNCI